MNRLTIGVDCDDVLVHTAQTILDGYNRRHGTSLTLEDYYIINDAAWGVPDAATAFARVDDYLQSDEYVEHPPDPDAIAVVRLLARHHKLHLITGRRSFLRQRTEAMLNEHFPGAFASIVHTNYFSGSSTSKADICRDLGIDVMIEDNAQHARAVAEADVQVGLYGNYPWNRNTGEDHANIRRVSGWREIGHWLVPHLMAELEQSQPIPSPEPDS